MPKTFDGRGFLRVEDMPRPEVVIEVARDFSRPEYPRFLVHSSQGVETPEDYVSHYVESHGFERCMRTQRRRRESPHAMRVG